LAVFKVVFEVVFLEVEGKGEWSPREISTNGASGEVGTTPLLPSISTEVENEAVGKVVPRGGVMRPSLALTEGALEAEALVVAMPVLGLVVLAFILAVA
jgi:hypothetical protein